MNKQELIKKMAEESKLTKADSQKALDAFVKATTKALKKGDKVALVGFGSFSISKSRIATNPQTGKAIKISSAKIGKFKAMFEAASTISEPNYSSAFSDVQSPISKIELLNELDTAIDSRSIVNDLSEVSNLPLKVLAEHVFEMTPKTLTSYKTQNKPVTKRTVEVYIKIKELYNKGIEIFESTEKFNSWLSTPAYGLGNKIPISYISSSTGIDLIFEELIRIEFGATA
ncbi:MAG: DNA-binding protein [Bacteroidetes bacterium]|nr:DNA-binding protein [Bacteroidota bacterium]